MYPVEPTNLSNILLWSTKAQRPIPNDYVVQILNRVRYACRRSGSLYLYYWVLTDKMRWEPDEMLPMLQKTFSNIFVHGNDCILIQISLTFLEGSIDNKRPLVQVMP